ncbi:MAG TPA: hypothetical protein VHC69_08805 [Polyangiaceae bacterium]|nr:hypothetical protein [Polyangiaceae bacterium]
MSARAQRSDELGNVRNFSVCRHTYDDASDLELESDVATSDDANGQDFLACRTTSLRDPVPDRGHRDAETLGYCTVRLTRVHRRQNLSPELFASRHRHASIRRHDESAQDVHPRTVTSLP